LPEPGVKQRPVPGLDTEEPGFSGDGDHDALDCKRHHSIWRNQAITLIVGFERNGDCYHSDA
jgi:hypothetical protein